MIYITGDTHIPMDITKLSTKRFPQQKEMTEHDFLIICGDFGGVWCGDNEELYWRKWLEEKNFTTLFVDGNHENFDLLNEFPVSSFFGGKAHKISDKIFHLMRGEIYEIEGKKIFTFGGAASHDRDFRTEGKNWWNKELPSEEEMNAGIQNLEKARWDVNFVITHCAPTNIQKKIAPDYEENILTDFLQSVKEKLSYEKWFFGHYHKDQTIDDHHLALFQSVLKV